MATHAGSIAVIVVIDDDPDVRDLVEAYFRPRGYHVRLYDTAEAALDDLKHHRTSCDVVLTDFLLEGMDGLQLIQAWRELDLAAPVIFMTAQQSAEVAMQAIEAGAYDFIVKPIHFPQLLVSVERALRLNSIRRENLALKAAVRDSNAPLMNGVIARSPGFRRVMELAKRVSDSTASVFISGESGTGKEVVAKAIHTLGRRKDKPFIAVNCSAIPDALLESELFGHAKGAFTGAVEGKAGLFEEADGGTLFLDEIGDLGLPLQAKLLRALQEREIKRVGEAKTRSVDVRVVSATHKDLAKEVAGGRFREDLFFRLNVIPLMIPPLRERREDILPLAEFFLAKYAALNGSPARGFTRAAVQKLIDHPWAGNVRELENTIERAVVLCDETNIDSEDLFESTLKSRAVQEVRRQETTFPLGSDGQLLPLEELIQQYVAFALERNAGAKDRTARQLKIDRKTLYKRVREINF